MTPHDDGPSFPNTYNMDGSWVSDVAIETRQGDTVSRDQGRSRVLVMSYGPAVQALGVPMLSLQNKLATDLDYEDPYDVNFNYYTRTRVTGELTREGGFFSVRIEAHSSSGFGWIEQDWTFTNLAPVERNAAPADLLEVAAGDLLASAARAFQPPTP